MHLDVKYSYLFLLWGAKGGSMGGDADGAAAFVLFAHQGATLPL